METTRLMDARRRLLLLTRAQPQPDKPPAATPKPPHPPALPPTFKGRQAKLLRLELQQGGQDGDAASGSCRVGLGVQV